MNELDHGPLLGSHWRISLFFPEEKPHSLGGGNTGCNGPPGPLWDRLNPRMWSPGIRRVNSTASSCRLEGLGHPWIWVSRGLDLHCAFKCSLPQPPVTLSHHRPALLKTPSCLFPVQLSHPALIGRPGHWVWSAWAQDTSKCFNPNDNLPRYCRTF